jgi:5-hydroxyisourate hydrolase
VAQGANHPVPTTPTISTHVLDTERGLPSAGVHVTLYKLADDGRPLRLTQALTDEDGRIRDLLERPLSIGDYRLEFSFAPDLPGDERAGEAPAERFFQRLTLDLHVSDVTRSYHVPLLLAPYSITTYRGS